MSATYQILPPNAPVAAPGDLLEAVVRSGTQLLLQTALEAEGEELLGRARYQRVPEFRGYRNGPGGGPDPAGAGRSRGGFESAIVHRYERRSQTQARLLARLYLEGLSSGDFEPVFRALVGSTAALYPNSMLRLKQEWAHEYQLWRARPLTDLYVYLFADGIYLKTGLEHEKTVLLVVIAVAADSRKELQAIEESYRESRESWAGAAFTAGTWHDRGAPHGEIPTTLRDAISRVLMEFPAARHQWPAAHPLTHFIRHDLAETVSDVVGPTYKFEGSSGRGPWAETPWVAIFDVFITVSASSGYYAVYLFRSVGAAAYLVLGQATTEIQKLFGRR